MDQRTKGAWLIHHAQKVGGTTNQDFENVLFAGKAAVLLSAISSEETQDVFTHDKIRSLAKANQISVKTELPVILEELARQHLIIKSGSGVEVLGVATSAVVEHAAKIFDESSPEKHESAALGAADYASERPRREPEFLELISDEYQLSTPQAKELLSTGSYIGFYDAENLTPSERLYFNGNLFRKDGVRKLTAALDSFSADEGNKLRELQSMLTEQGCISLHAAMAIAGEVLCKKLQSIGLLDVSGVGNESGQHYFVTTPAAFSKFTNSIADDALDLAKALVTSLTYGMTQSVPGRGRIIMLQALMRKLLSGAFVGPATAIGRDYQVLEFKRVIEVRQERNGLFSMRLLKPEVGRLALSVLEEGSVIPSTLPALAGANVSVFTAPERTRVETRLKNSTPALKSGVAAILDDLRTGAI